MAQSNQAEREEQRRQAYGQAIDAVFGDHFDILSKLEKRPKKITPKDKTRYEAARAAVEDLEARRVSGIDDGKEQILRSLRASLDAATEFITSPDAVSEGERPKKAEQPSAEELRERRRTARETAEEAPEVPEGAAGNEQAEREPMESLESVADDWHRRAEYFENQAAYFDRWFFTLRSQEHAMQVAREVNEDIVALTDDIVSCLSGLGISIQTVDDVPEALRDAVIRYNNVFAKVEEMATRAAQYDALVEAHRAELEAKNRDAVPIAREFITSCGEAQREIDRVLALPHGTPEERYIARAQVEGLVKNFKMYNDQWDERAKPHLQDGETWLPIWQEAVEAHRGAHRAYAAVKDRRGEFMNAAAQDWEVNRVRFDGKLDVLRTRLIAAQMKRGDERQAELEGIREYYIGIREEWDDLFQQAPRELKVLEDSPVRKLGGVVRAIGRNLEELLNQKDAYVLRAQEAYGELGRAAISAFGCWNNGKTFAQRGAFLHKYLENQIQDADPEFSEFVTNREVFIQIVAPLAAAKSEIDVQENRRQGRAEEREKNRQRRNLRHPWLFNLRADRQDLFDEIIEGKFWKQETPPEERRRLIRVGERIADDDAALVAAVRSVDQAIPTFRRALSRLAEAKAGIIAFEDRLLTEEQEPVVPMDVEQLRRLGREYAHANGDEYRALQAILALDGWKIADSEERRKAVGEYWRYPNRKTAEKLTDNPDAFREPLNAWRAAVEQKLNRRDAFRWALERNRELIPTLGTLSKSAQKTVDIVVANANRPAPEPAAARTPEVLDARGEAIRDRQRDIGNLLAHDMFWDTSVERRTRFARINALLRRRRADARLNSDDGLRNVEAFYDAAGFTDFADLEARIARLRAALAPAAEAAPAAVVPAPAVAAAAPTPEAIVPAAAPVSPPLPVVARSTTTPSPTVPASPTTAAPSRPAAITAPVSAIAATGAAGIIGRLTSRIEARRAPDTFAPAGASTPPPLPAPDRSVSATSATTGSTPEVSRVTPPSIRAALPPAPTLVRRGEPAPVVATARAAEAPVGTRLEPSPAAERAAELARTDGAAGAVVSPAAARAESAPVLAPTPRAPGPMRRELPPTPELTNEVRVSSWARSLREGVGRLFGRNVGDYVASELTGEQMERERRNEAISRPEVMARTASSFIGIAGRVLGFQSLVDVPRYFTQSFMKENERALLRAEILEAMEHESAGRAAGREGDRQRASIEASTRLERAINTSAHLTAAQKADMIARVNTMRITYQERSFAVAEARSKELAELVEANVQSKVNGWRAAKETVNSALAVLSFGGAPLVAGIGYGAARGVSYLAMSLQEKYVAAAVQNPRASWVGKVQTAFRDTLASTWNRLSAPTETFGQRMMNVVDALSEISNAVGVQPDRSITGLERSLPALRSVEEPPDSGLAAIVANAQLAIQNTIDRLLPVFERLTARQGSNPVAT